MGKKLTVFLIDGKEFGPKLIEIGNWVGKGIYSPRNSFIDLLNKRNEFNNPGIYFLKSNPTSKSFSERIYIGEAENIGNRIKQHLADSNKDFFEIAFFISKDELLTKSQIKYLETRLISLAKEAKSSEIDNSATPSLPTLHEADISDMEYFIDQIKFILPIMGFNFLKPSTIKHEQTETKTKDKSLPQFQIRNSNYKAQMVVTDDGFIIRKNSQANKNVSPSMTDNYKILRQKLIETNILVDKGEFYEFLDDTVFSSPSAASNIILGRQSAGPIEWVNIKGKTYKEIIENLPDNSC